MSDLLPESLTFFIDRNSGGRTFRDILTSNGLNVVLHDEYFPIIAADEDWLIPVGERGWIVITGDDATTRTPLFLHRLSKSKTFVFVLKGLNGATREGKAACILSARETIEKLVSENSPPALWRIGKDGTARAFDFHATLIRMQRSRRNRS